MKLGFQLLYHDRWYYFPLSFASRIFPQHYIRSIWLKLQAQKIKKLRFLEWKDPSFKAKYTTGFPELPETNANQNILSYIGLPQYIGIRFLLSYSLETTLHLSYYRSHHRKIFRMQCQKSERLEFDSLLWYVPNTYLDLGLSLFTCKMGITFTHWLL